MNADLDMQLDDQHVPDGKLPLEIGFPPRSTTPAFAPASLEPSASEPLTCHVVVHNTAFGMPIPVSCRREIRPGEHYLLHTQRMRDRPTGLTFAYCAPCAVRDYHWWQVREATS